MTTKHTPGPWHWNGAFNVTVGSGSSWIARTVGLASGEGTDTEREPSEARANAALIASAPDLLAALRAMEVAVPCASIHCRHYGLNDGVPCIIEARRLTRAALAKAEGRT